MLATKPALPSLYGSVLAGHFAAYVEVTQLGSICVLSPTSNYACTPALHVTNLNSTTKQNHTIVQLA